MIVVHYYIIYSIYHHIFLNYNWYIFTYMVYILVGVFMMGIYVDL